MTVRFWFAFGLAAAAVAIVLGIIAHPGLIVLDVVGAAVIMALPSALLYGRWSWRERGGEITTTASLLRLSLDVFVVMVTLVAAEWTANRLSGGALVEAVLPLTIAITGGLSAVCVGGLFTCWLHEEFSGDELVRDEVVP